MASQLEIDQAVIIMSARYDVETGNWWYKVDNPGIDIIHKNTERDSVIESLVDRIYNGFDTLECMANAVGDPSGSVTITIEV